MPARNQAGIVAGQAGPADIGAQRIDGTAGGAADLAGQRVAAVVGAAHAAVVIIDPPRPATGDGCYVLQGYAPPVVPVGTAPTQQKDHTLTHTRNPVFHML